MAKILQTCDNFLNPLMLRELRQIVRSRFMIVLINLYLLMLVFASLGFTVFDQNFGNEGVGANLFAALTGIMVIACLLAVVGLTASTTAAERMNEDMMFISTLRPSAIVFGKAQAGIILTVILMSITAPFVTLAYLLRGLDIQIVVITFVLTFLAIQLANSFAIFLSTNVKTKAMGAGLAFFGFFFVPWLFASMASFLAMRTGVSWALTGLDIELFVTICAAIALEAVLLSFAIVSFSPRTSNRMLPVRLTLSVLYVLSFAAWCLLSYYVSSIFRMEEWCAAWQVIISVVLFIAVSERDTLSIRIRRSVPKNIVLRIAAFPFFTGSASGILWWCLLESGVVVMWFNIFPISNYAAFTYPICMLMFVFDYCITALLLRQLLLRRWMPAEQTWVIVLFLLFLLTAGLMILYAFLNIAEINTGGLNGYNNSLFAAFNPFMMDDTSLHSFVSLAWGTVLLLPLTIWFLRQVRQFMPLSEEERL